jgi:hypothetical protein
MAKSKVTLTLKTVPESPVVFQDAKIQGVLIGVITLETPLKEYLKLDSLAKEEWFSFWVNKDGIRVDAFDILKSNEEDYPFTGWSFPKKPKIKKELEDFQI